MKDATENIFGLTLVSLACILGSYFFALLLFIAGLREGELLAAPFMLPFYLAVVLLLIGETDGLLPGLFIWCLAIVGCWGLLKSWLTKTIPWWPFLLLLILDAILFSFWLRR